MLADPRHPVSCPFFLIMFKVQRMNFFWGYRITMYEFLLVWCFARSFLHVNKRNKSGIVLLQDPLIEKVLLNAG